jgi:flagellar assembly factor FliW
MPEYQSKYFGKLIYKEESVIHFPAGMPGFGNEGRFLLIEQAMNKPIVFLQSLSEPELCFITLPVLGIRPHYKLAIAPEDLQTLDLPENRQPAIGDEVLGLAIVSVSEDRPPTVNLLSPIVINWKTRCAVQAVQPDAGYSHEHPLFGEATVDSCS